MSLMSVLLYFKDDRHFIPQPTKRSLPLPICESPQELEINAPEGGLLRGPVPASVLASPAAVYSLAPSNLKRELIMLFEEKRVVTEGEPSVVAKETPLAHESDARWYVTIVNSRVGTKGTGPHIASFYDLITPLSWTCQETWATSRGFHDILRRLPRFRFVARTTKET